jgi:hypothetical protein
MKIRLSAQIGIGNFGDHVDGTQKTASEIFAQLVRARLTEYCEKVYPDSELIFDFSVENVSGCCTPFSVDVGNDFTNESRAIEADILIKYESICNDLERSGVAYEY